MESTRGAKTRAAEQRTASVEAQKSQGPEEIGFFSSIVAYTATKLTAPATLDGVSVKPINGTWSGLLYDLSRFLIVEKAELGNNEPLINNVSMIVRNVLLAIGAMKANTDKSVDLNHPEFMKNLTLNLLEIFNSHVETLNTFDPQADPNSQKGKDLRKELGLLFNELLEKAGLDEKSIKKQPYAVQQLLYPDFVVAAAQGAFRFFSKKEEGEEEKPSINKEGLEKMFIDGFINILTIQKKLEAKSKSSVLDENEGASKAVDDFVSKTILKKIRSGELAFAFPFLKGKENVKFLNTMINEILGEQKKDTPENQLIKDVFDKIENQLKMAIKGILAVVLTPNEGQTFADRRNTLLISILDRMSNHTEALKSRNKIINEMDRGKLENELEREQGAKGPYSQKAKELLERKDISWENEVKDFLNKFGKYKLNKTEYSHADLLKELKKFDQEKEINPRWSALRSDKAQDLLKRENLDWESGARQLLKKIQYVDKARIVLAVELSPAKFAEFIPKFLKAQDLFQEIYEFIGETAFEFHEQQQTLEKMGAEASSFIDNSKIPQLSNFVNEMIKAATETIEDQAQQNKIDVGYGKFLNQMVCHLLKEEEVDLRKSGLVTKPIKGKQLAKQEVVSLSKNVLMIIIKKAIENNTNEKCPQDKAFSNLINKFVKNSVNGLREIGEECKKLKMDTLGKRAAVISLAEELKTKIPKIEASDAKLIEQYRGLLVKKLARKLIEQLAPKDLFNSLLPPMFRESDLWESVTDEMVAPFLEGISGRLVTFQAATIVDSKEAKQLKLVDDNGQSHPLQPLIKQMAGKAIDFVTDINFSKLLKQEDADSKFNKINFEILDDLFGNAFKQEGEIVKLIESILPPFIESILALKLNPKDGKTSQELATKMIWSIFEITNACYDRMDAIRVANHDLETLKKEFSGTDELKEEKIGDTIETYCKENKIKGGSATILENKEFYIWLKLRQEMKISMKTLMDELIPEDMWNLYVPKQFEKLITREKVADLMLEYLKEGYDHSINMKKLVSEGKSNLQKVEANKPDALEPKKKAKTKGETLQKFIEKKVVAGLKDASKPVEGDEPDIVWMKGVLAKLIKKQDASPEKLLTLFSTNTAYAILGKLLSGGPSSFVKIPDKFNIADVKVGQKCSDYPQIKADHVKKYLSLKGGGLKSHEVIKEISKKFEKKGDSIVFKVTINNTKTKKSREVSVDAKEFIKMPSISQITNDSVKKYLSLKKNFKNEEIIEKLPANLELKNDKIVFKVTVKDTKTGESREVIVDASQFISWKINYQTNFIGKISKLIPVIRKDFIKLNKLKEGMKCSEFSQITPDNIKGYLSLGKGSLNETEIVEKLPKHFEVKDDKIVFKVTIRDKDPKKDTSREEFINASQFIYWEAAFLGINSLISDDDWKELVPKLMLPIMTKEVIAEFAVPYVQALHQVQEPLQQKAEAGQKRLDELAAEDPDGKLKEFVDKNVFKKIHEVLDDMAKDPKRIVKKEFPDAIEKFARDILKSETNPNIAELKDVLIKRVVYMLANEFLKPGEPKHAVSKPNKTNLVADNIASKFSALIQTYQNSNKATKAELKKLPRKMAEQLLKEVLPESTWNEIFIGKFKDLVSRADIIDGIEEKLKEVLYSIDVVKAKQGRAMERIKVLDQKAGLIDGRGGGLQEMVKTICQSIDETIDEYAGKKGKIADGQPMLVNAIAKMALKDPNISNVIKETTHALVAICVSRMFLAKPGEEAKHTLEMMTDLVNLYDPENPKATAIAWLNVFIPEKPTDLLKEIVPPFLKDTLNREFLADLLLDYFVEVKEVVDAVKTTPTKDEEIKALQKFIKKTVEQYKNPQYSRDGLTGFGGFIKKLETAIVGTFAGDKEWDGHKKFGKTVETFLNSTVEKIMTTSRIEKLRDKQFLSEAMINVLPMFGDVDPAKDVPGYPSLDPNQLVDLSTAALKKKGFDLEQFADETPEAFKQRIINKDFENKCGILACELAFPNGADDLPVPKVAKPAIFSKVQEAIGGQIGRIVNRNERILFAIDFLGLGVDKDDPKEKKDIYAKEQKELNALEDHLKATGKLTGKEEKSAERLFKERLESFAMKKVEDNVASTWYNPFRWLAVKFTQLIVKMALKFGVSGQVWKFVSDEKNDAKFRFAIWKFLSFAKQFEPKKKDDKEIAKDSKELKNQFTEGFKNMGLLGGIRPMAASGVAGFLTGKNFVNIIV